MVRQLALTEELQSRGHEVVLVGDTDVEWVARAIGDRGVRLVPPAHPSGIAAEIAGQAVDVVMIDGYDIPGSVGQSLLDAGIPVATMVDGDFGLQQKAVLYVDQNLNATRPAGIPADAAFLGGLDHALLRDQIRDRRGRVDVDPVPPRVLVVFGGTDAFGGAAVITDLLLATGAPVTVVAVAATPPIAAELEALTELAAGKGQSVEITGPVPDLGELAVSCQAAVSAAGTTVWELLCLGVPTGLVCVTDNQEFGYEEARSTRIGDDPVCVPVGMLSALRSDAAARAAAVGELTALVADPPLRRRLSAATRTLVDGDGRVRVADALERLASDRVR